VVSTPNATTRRGTPQPSAPRGVPSQSRAPSGAHQRSPRLPRTPAHSPLFNCSRNVPRVGGTRPLCELRESTSSLTERGPVTTGFSSQAANDPFRSPRFRLSRQHGCPFAGTSKTGATGLEPATSGVTGRATGFDRFRPKSPDPYGYWLRGRISHETPHAPRACFGTFGARMGHGDLP
jgi:hypothetical protein